MVNSQSVRKIVYNFMKIQTGLFAEILIRVIGINENES